VNGAEEPDRRLHGRARRRAFGALAAAGTAAVAAWYGWQAWSGDRAAANPGRTTGSATQSVEQPLGSGERASYRVTWGVGSGGGLPAGQAAFEASGVGGARHLSLDLETAAWAASLLDVRGRIESWTDATSCAPSSG
jgi:hypothetical protein